MFLNEFVNFFKWLKYLQKILKKKTGKSFFFADSVKKMQRVAAT